MFDFVRRHTRLLQFLLLLLIVPSFVVFGIQGYDKFSEGKDAVARVDGHDVTRAEWDAASRNQIERMRAQMPNMDVKMFDTPEVKQRVLEELVASRAIAAAARDLHLTPGDERVERVFKSDPQFAGYRNEDGSVRKDLLASQGMTSPMFLERLRQDIAQRQVTEGVAGSSFTAATVAGSAIDAFFQRREVRVQRFDAKDQLPKAQATDAEIQAYYDDAHTGARFQSPESVNLEYVVLDLASISRSLTVPEDDLRKYYTENKARYEQPSERRARHILVKAEASATADVKAAAKAKAEALLAEVRKAPATFADVARKNSDDPGSAKNGGDLDWFARGQMVKPFEDAAFQMKKGDISNVVQSDFGYHIIMLDDVRGGDVRPFEAARGEIEDEVKKTLAQKRYVELAEQFTNMAEQEDTLKPVADKLKLDLKTVQNFTKGGVKAEPGSVLANPKVAELAFQPDNLGGKRNSLAAEIGTNQMISLRVTAHQPARKQPLADVREQVRTAVLQNKAAKAARTEGEARLAQWKTQAPAAGTLPAAIMLSRGKAQNMPPKLVDAVLKAKADPLPAWLGVDLGDEGYAVVLIEKVLPADAADTGAPEQIRSQYNQMWSRAEVEAYQLALRKRYKTEIVAKAKLPEESAASAPASGK